MDQDPFPRDARDRILSNHELRLQQLNRDINDLRACVYAWGFITFMIGVVALLLP